MLTHYIRGTLQEFLERTGGDGRGDPMRPCERFVFFDSQHSCPFGRARSVWDCPDIQNLVLLDRRGLIDLRVLVLTRPLVSCFLSSARRFHDNGTSANRELHLWDMMLQHMQVSISGLPCQKVMFVPFHYVLKKPPELADMLAEFIGKPSQAAQIADNIQNNITLPESWLLNNFSTTNQECTELGLDGAKCRDFLQDMAKGYFDQRQCDLYPCFADGGDCQLGARLEPRR